MQLQKTTAHIYQAGTTLLLEMQQAIQFGL